MATPLSPEIQVHNRVTVVQLGPEYERLSENLMDDLRDALLQCGREADPPLVVVDLSHTTFFGSTFIEILVHLWKLVSERQGGDFALCGLHKNCAEVLKVTHLDSLWKVYNTQQEAVAALAGD